MGIIKIVRKGYVSIDGVRYYARQLLSLSWHIIYVSNVVEGQSVEIYKGEKYICTAKPII